MVFRFLFPLLFILSLSCSGGNTRTAFYKQQILPDYQLISQRDFTSPSKLNSTQIPLEVSSESFFYLKEAVNNGNYPQNVRTEELLNSFIYNFPEPNENQTFGLNVETATSPWNENRKLIQIGINAKSVTEKEDTNSPKNLIFAVDISGSMSGPNGLDLAKLCLKRFVQSLNPTDNVSIITYNTEANIFLPPTSLYNKPIIISRISQLYDTGGTNAWTGIQLAYQIAREMNTNKKQTKIIIVTDGDFGGVNDKEFFSLVEKEKKIGITASILGFSIRSKSSTIDAFQANKIGETILINSIEEARQKLTNEWLNFISLATDLNLEIKFNPATVESFRLIGFEKYIISKVKKTYDADSSFRYNALYEIIPSKNIEVKSELANIRFSYKSKNRTEEISKAVQNLNLSTWDASDNLRLAAGIAGLGMLVNHSKEKGDLDYAMVIHLIQTTVFFDPDNKRAEFLKLVQKMKNFE